MTKTWRCARVAVLVLGLGVLAACSPTYRNHGYIPAQEDLDAIIVGVDTRASVEETIGSPTSAGLLQGGNFYYVRKRVKHVPVRKPIVEEREVLAITFDDGGVVRNIERFGLEDGKVVVLQRRVSDSSVVDRSFLRQLLGSLGRFNPGALAPE